MLKIEDLDVSYNGLQALYSVSIHVEAHEVVCILGPNGAGKSTLLQAIAGMLKPENGSILFLGQPIQALPPHKVAATGLSLVPEEGWLYPQMSVEENLLMGAFPKSARPHAKTTIDFIYNIFPRLLERRRQSAETLSGGERQMLAVGRGLMTKPQLIILDEPSLGLAPLVVKDILDTLAKINQEEKTTILLTEQNIFHALKIAGRGYLLENGRVAMEGTSAELLNDEHICNNYLGM